MLLPSALSCDQKLSLPKTQRPQRPKLQSFERYDPRQRSQSPMVGLIASCRALHGILGERLSATPSPSIETSQISTSPFGIRSPSPVRPVAPRGQNKRTRDDYEASNDATNPNEADQTQMDTFLTPKRRRVIPLEIPRGLQASDFETLDEATPRPHGKILTSQISRERAHISSQKRDRDRIQPADIIMSLEPPPPLARALDHYSDWTEGDDRMLVETVLSKLSLSKRDWNDCAQQLGKDQATLGRRWQRLLGGGNIGLRRGSGRMERPDLDIRSW